MKIFILLIFALLMGCDSQQNEFHFSGEINSGNVVKIIAQLKYRKVLAIESAGGEEAAAMELGRFISNNKIDLAIDKFCLSACAIYLVPAAKTVRMRAGSIIAFSVVSGSIFKSLSPLVPPDERAAIEFYGNETTNYLSGIGRNSDLLDAAGVISAPVCVNVISHSIRSKITVWVPTPTDFVRFGIDVKGDVVMNVDDARSRLAKILRPDRLYSFVPWDGSKLGVGSVGVCT